MEAVLEAALHARSSLSQGDWVDAQHAGRSYNLRVQHLEPESAVSVIGESLVASHKVPEAYLVLMLAACLCKAQLHV